MGKRRWSDEDIILLAKLNKERVPLHEMAEKLGKSYAALVQFRHANGITYPDVISNRDMQTAIELRQRGYSCSKIARKFNVSADFARKHLRHITPMYSGSIWNMDMLDKLEDAVLHSKDLTEVSDKLNKTLESVKRICIVQYGTYRMDRLRKAIKFEGE